MLCACLLDRDAQAALTEHPYLFPPAFSLVFVLYRDALLYRIVVSEQTDQVPC